MGNKKLTPALKTLFRRHLGFGFILAGVGASMWSLHRVNKIARTNDFYVQYNKALDERQQILRVDESMAVAMKLVTRDEFLAGKKS